MVKLLAIDHPAGTQIFADERYTPPPFPEFKIYTAKEIHHPRTARDHHGNDISDALKATDYRYAIEHEPGTFQGVADPHSIVLDLGEIPDGLQLTLFLTGWIFPTDTSINVALSQNPSINPVFPYLQVRDEGGKWQTVIDPIAYLREKQDYLHRSNGQIPVGGSGGKNYHRYADLLGFSVFHNRRAGRADPYHDAASESRRPPLPRLF